jgi:glycosyltransferase involved in cell wall biosynthesis
MQRTSILFIGHDLKFLNHVINHFGTKTDYRIEVKTYSGHALPDTDKIQKELARFDLIFCEWGLGNLQWFSHNKIPGQKLITRIHLQELNTNYLAETNWENVDKIIVVGPLMKEKLVGSFPACQDKCVVIPNLIDTKAFDLEKDENARFNLGLLGILPMRKAPHLAVELLRELRKSDERYKLHIKSKRPEELPWLWKKQEEQDYYSDFYRNIEEEDLKGSVILDPHGSDVEEWFRKIGFIISPSEFESFHMAIAEGMASGTIPVIRNWEGSEALFPGKLIFSDLQEAVAMVLKNTGEKAHQALGEELKEFCRKNFSLEVILPKYDQIMTTRIEGEKMTAEYYKLLVLRKQLATDLLSTEEELEKAHEIEGVYHNLEREYESLEAKLQDIESRYRGLYVKYNDLNIKYKELYSKYQVLASQKVVYIQQVENLKTKSQKIKNDLDLVKNNFNLQLDKNKKLKEQFDELNKSYKETTNSLKLTTKKLKDTNQKINAMQNSLSWKVGTALIAKPASVIRKVIK